MVVAPGCGNNDGDDPTSLESGKAVISVRSVTAIGEITRVTVDVTPAGIVGQELTYDAAAGSFSAAIGVPAGEQVFDLKAFNGTTVVAQGSATAIVTQGQTTAVAITLLDTTGPQPDVGRSPVITALVVPKIQVNVGESIILSATAVDVDQDPLTFTWTDDCTTSTLTTPAQASTAWSNSAEGTCVITLTVEANGQSASKAVSVATIGVGSGVAAIEGVFIPQPTIERVDVFAAGTGFTCAVYRTFSTDATCTGTVFPTQRLGLASSVVYGTTLGTQASTWTDNGCGGTFNGDSAWTAPSTPAVCKLTRRASNSGLVTEFSVAVQVAGCIDDRFEDNDLSGNASSIVLLPLSGPEPSTQIIDALYTNDDDWFRFEGASPDSRPFTVSTNALDDLVVEIYDANLGLLVSGTAAAPVTTNITARSFVRIAPAPNQTQCSGSYDLTINYGP